MFRRLDQAQRIQQFNAVGSVVSYLNQATSGTSLKIWLAMTEGFIIRLTNALQLFLAANAAQ